MAALSEDRAFVVTAKYPLTPRFGTEPEVEFHARMEQPDVRSPPDPPLCQDRCSDSAAA
jgi:hypothetical protein